MGRRIRIRAIEKKEPLIRLYVLALLSLARQLEEQEQADKAPAAKRPEADR